MAKHRIKISSIIVSLLLISSVSFVDASIKLPSCMDKAKTQFDLNMCSMKLAKISQDSLNKLIKQLHHKFKDHQTLDKAQTAWSKYQKLHCQFISQQFAGGSIQPLEYNGCIEKLNWQRVDDLKVMLCEGAGMTGPCQASKAFNRH